MTSSPRSTRLAPPPTMKDAEQLLTDAGWWGTKIITDVATGELVKAVFDPARLRLI